MPRESWTVRVSRRAQADVQAIRRWTQQQFGEEQEQTYAELIVDTLDELRVSGVESLGVKARSEISAGLYSLHLARRGRKGRHTIFFRRSDTDSRLLLVLRILHDTMDSPRHI